MWPFGRVASSGPDPTWITKGKKLSLSSCCACQGVVGSIVLDLGDQPASDNFPLVDDPGPDATYRLQMWLCAECGLAQLVDDPTDPDEPLGVEPAAAVVQSVEAVELLASAGWLRAGGNVAEYRSPHGGSLLQLIADRGLEIAAEDELADVVVDSFGLMHWRDQAAAIAERTNRVARDGVLLMQYHELRAIVLQGQWNMLRLGHYAYHSLSTLVDMLARAGFRPRSAWSFDLYGGTVLLAATRDGSPDASVSRILRDEEQLGLSKPESVCQLQRRAEFAVDGLKGWLTAQKESGRRVFGYGAASRAVATLAMAGVDCDDISGVADASSGKWGRRMPGTNIPIVSQQI